MKHPIQPIRKPKRIISISDSIIVDSGKFDEVLQIVAELKARHPLVVSDSDISIRGGYSGEIYVSVSYDKLNENFETELIAYEKDCLRYELEIKEWLKLKR